VLVYLLTNGDILKHLFGILLSFLFFSASTYSFEVAGTVLARCGSDKYMAKIEEISDRGNILVLFNDNIVQRVCGDLFFNVEEISKIENYDPVETYEVIEYRNSGLRKIYRSDTVIVEKVSVGDIVNFQCAQRVVRGVITE
jgi:hypothetical protein